MSVPDRVDVWPPEWRQCGCCGCLVHHTKVDDNGDCSDCAKPNKCEENPSDDNE